jgi:hypothetical protein
LKHFFTEGKAIGSNEDRIVAIKEGSEHEFEFYDDLRPIITVHQVKNQITYLISKLN